MLNGTVKWFSEERGYGFITAEENDFFVHYSSIIGKGFRSLKEGDNVTFEVGQNERGDVAVNVTKQV